MLADTAGTRMQAQGESVPCGRYSQLVICNREELTRDGYRSPERGSYAVADVRSGSEPDQAYLDHEDTALDRALLT